ncbi:aromatic di-alanine and TPR containing protein [Ceratobasidium theobromae]|uniref:Aromatic di-alanine and TPR containing protein n=1 Tax=Ceratobasidium theobromae TaxID=1582974 RepID=A0A5N5Q8E3_9AGAM|nr:aromatic di-alanine and TPR containing protein [Ceratobasidium theobromae]
MTSGSIGLSECTSGYQEVDGGESWHDVVRKRLDQLNIRIMSGENEDTNGILHDAFDLLSELETNQESTTGSCSKDPERLLLRSILEVRNASYSRFKQDWNPGYIDLAIRTGLKAVLLTPKSDVSKADLLHNVYISHQDRFKCLGQLQDLDKAIAYQTQAVLFTPEGDISMPTRLSDLGGACLKRFERLGKLEDIDKAIEQYSLAASLISGDSKDMAMILFSNLGAAHKTRFDRLGQADDIDKSIECHTHAVSAIPEGHSTAPELLGNLGSAYLSRFHRLSRPDDVEKAIECHTRALSLVSEACENTPRLLSGLGDSYQFRFELLGGIEDINRAVEYQFRGVSLVPEGHSSISTWLGHLGKSHMCRFKRLGQLDDINKAIEYQTRSVSLAPQHSLNMPTLLNNLGISYHARFERLGKYDDIEMAIQYNNQAVMLTPEDHPDMPMSLSNLGIAHRIRFSHLGQLEDIDKAIECQTRAVSLTPKGHAYIPVWLNNLGNSHQSRFNRSGKLEDLDKAIEFKAEAVSFTPSGHPNLPLRLSNLGISYRTRFERLKQLDDIDKAIQYQTKAVSLTPGGHATLPAWLNNLGNSHYSRFENIEKIEDIDKAIEHNARAVALTSGDHVDLPSRLSNLGNAHALRFHHLGKLDDNDKAIQYHNEAISLTPEGNANIPAFLNNLGDSHMSRFESLRNIEDINRAIEVKTQALSLTPEGHANVPPRLTNLGNAQWKRYQLSSDPESLDRSVECFRRAALSTTGDPRSKFFAACKWAQVTSSEPITDHLLAFQTAVNLIPHVIWFGTTITQRYSDARLIGDIATEAAAAAISAQQYDCALEWLEHARSIVWNQALQLRSPLDRLFAASPCLANTLQQVARELHDASFLPPHAATMPNDASFMERAAQRHRRLAEKYDELVDEVREIPGFENFLRPKKAPEFIGAAKTGPIFLINVHTSRCDALAVLPQCGKVEHIPLLDFSPAKAVKARALIQHSLHGLRERGFRVATMVSSQEDAFRNALAVLWTDVVRPILDHFELLYLVRVRQNVHTVDLPHVTWCATGPLAFLPLHAAGLFSEPGARVFDYVVSSYTPTLSALLFSDSALGNASHSSILSIGQENTPGHSALPETKSELSCIEKLTQSRICHTKLDGDNATIASVLNAMETHDWVHLACHAYQDLKDPTESGFFLHNGTLSLDKIMQQSFQNKGLAFLSACQTAAGDQELPDEVVHLASGMMLAGYPSVIATMWSVVDRDAPVIAERVYEQLLKSGKMDHKEAAKALHAAVGDLRAKVGEAEFARWVPYIHIGV